MALTDTYKDRAACLAIAERAAFTEDEGLADRLDLTMVGEYYRPFAAAYSWLASHPKWAQKFTGSEGLEYRSLAEALAALAADQASADASLGLDVPEHLQLKMPTKRAPSPAFASWQ